MANKQVEIGFGSSPEPRKRGKAPLVVLIVLALVALPVGFEGILVCYGHWMEALDRPVDIRTPILDRISDGIESVRQDVGGGVSSYFDHANWDPIAVLGGAVVVMAIAAFMLRS